MRLDDSSAALDNHAARRMHISEWQHLRVLVMAEGDYGSSRSATTGSPASESRTRARQAMTAVRRLREELSDLGAARNRHHQRHQPAIAATGTGAPGGHGRDRRRRARRGRAVTAAPPPPSRRSRRMKQNGARPRWSPTPTRYWSSGSRCRRTPTTRSDRERAHARVRCPTLWPAPPAVRGQPPPAATTRSLVPARASLDKRRPASRSTAATTLFTRARCAGPPRRACWRAGGRLALRSHRAGQFGMAIFGRLAACTWSRRLPAAGK